jgi:endonuclease/exonuclease/phosphatase family metal-dependent hydrolase
MKILPSFPLLACVLLFSVAFLEPPLYRDPPQQKQILKILSYNIHHASPPSEPDSIDLNAIAQVITTLQPDLVALQEVDVFTARSGPFNQALELAKQTGLTPYFFKAIDFQGGEYGVAILSRYLVTDTKAYALPTKEGSGGEPRVLATATIQLANKQTIVFACTHLDAQRDSVNRMLQIDAIVETLRGSKHPVIIAGDFNATPASQVIGTLDKHFERTCEPCDFTVPVNDPTSAIDFIAYYPAKKFKVRRHSVVHERYASDHLPVFSILELSN